MKPLYRLADLLGQIPDHAPPFEEFDWGPDVGKERLELFGIEEDRSMSIFDEVSDLSVLRPPPRAFPYSPSYCRETVLFLDFDGVLHPEEGLSDRSPIFHEADRLEALLDDYSDISIVLSTSWQMLSGLDRLRTVFRPEYRDRIIGGTDQLNPESFSYGRDRLAQRWIACHARAKRWICLDDDITAFPYRDQRLLWCSEGTYGEQADRLLRGWLETSSTDIQHFIASRVPDDPCDWTARDAVAVTPEVDGWVDVSRVPRCLLELHAPDGPVGSVWELMQWRELLQRWCSGADRRTEV